jgi:hypothetical protein
MTIDTQTINRLKRVTALIDENAKQATPGRWSLSHSHLIGEKKDGEKYTYFDIASQPFKRDMCVYGVHPDHGGMGFKDMRYFSTVQPLVMTKLTEDVRTLLAERDDATALTTRLFEVLDNEIDDRTPAQDDLLAAVEKYLEQAGG